MKLNAKQQFLWFDIETTGDRPGTDLLLCFSAKLTTADMKTIAEFPDIYISYSAETLDAAFKNYPAGEEIRTMHTKSGLIPKLISSDVSLASALSQFYAWCVEHKVHGAYLSGNSIHFDRSFLLHHLPVLRKEGILYYRNFDVTSIGVFLNLFCGVELKDMGDAPHIPSQDLDRSIRIIRDHLELFKRLVSNQKLP